MQVSVETLKGLERKLTISVPTEKVEEEVGLRLKKLAHRVKIDGYRPGKVPFDVVVKRFSDSVREEVARDLVQPSLYEALKTNDLIPAGSPMVEPQEIAKGKDFKFTALFEIFPDIQVNELNQAEVEIVNASVQDADVNDMLEKLREQNKEWVTVTRAAKKGDKVVIDFKGYLGDEPFEGGSAEDYELVLGAGTMIPGFEDGVVGAKIDKPFDVNVTFPKDYGHAELAGKDVRFNVTVKEIKEGELPALNDAFAEKFNIKEGGVDALRNDIKQNMVRELERRVSAMNREKIFDKLLELNSFEAPMTLIEQEIGHLKHEMYHRVFGHEHTENEKIPDFPRSLFEEQATRRVHLGLLFSEYVKKHEIAADSARVNAMIETMASAYEKPEELRAWYRADKERIAEIEALVMEEMVSEKILTDAKVIKKTLGYEEVMNPKKVSNDEDKGE